jgi:hypothetical protein
MMTDPIDGDPWEHDRMITDLSQRDALIADLRALAAFLEDHPHVFAPSYVQIDAFPSLDDYKTTARAASWEKVPIDTWQALRRTFPGGLIYNVNIPREQVCRRVVVGRRFVEAVAAHEIEIVQWQCEPILAQEGLS